MKGIALRLLIAIGLVGAGWTIGRAQPSFRDFDLCIDAPGGESNITCVRGCQLAWIQRTAPAPSLAFHPGSRMPALVVEPTGGTTPDVLAAGSIASRFSTRRRVESPTPPAAYRAADDATMPRRATDRTFGRPT
jgi:hypothetical protein